MTRTEAKAPTLPMTETVVFTDDRYYESGTGQFWPRVTTILEAYPKGEGFYSWMKATGRNADDILQAAGEDGTAVHRGTQDYDSGRELLWATKHWTRDQWALLCRYADFCSFCNPEILLMEQSYVSDILQYGGTIDRVMNIEGKKILVDIKTSNYVYAQHWCQVAAYNALLHHCGSIAVDAVGILHLKAKTRTAKITDHGWQGKGWSLEIKPMSQVADDFDIFQKVYALWKHENQDHQPGVKTYPSMLKKSL